MLPNEFKFEHGTGEYVQLFHARREGDQIMVSWRKDEGHSADGEIDWEPSQVERYVEDGAWRIVEDKAPEPEFYSEQELIDLPQDTPVIVHTDAAAPTFKKGQVVYRASEYGIDDEVSCYFSTRPDTQGHTHYFTSDEVVKADTTDVLLAGVNGDRLRESIAQLEAGEAVEPPEDLGVYRPELETRKVGKVRVELVDDGFPLALREIAKVMTWAQTAKGYKDHDWQILPNAEQALAAAASRHRTDHIKQRIVEGNDIADCVDNESKLLHKAHEAFGVLAQLELMLRGEFDEAK